MKNTECQNSWASLYGGTRCKLGLQKDKQGSKGLREGGSISIWKKYRRLGSETGVKHTSHAFNSLEEKDSEMQKPRYPDKCLYVYKNVLIYLETFYSNLNGHGLCLLSLLPEDINILNTQFPLEMKINQRVYML